MKHLHLRIIELLEEKKISKTKICKDLDLQRGNSVDSIIMYMLG